MLNFIVKIAGKKSESTCCSIEIKEAADNETNTCCTVSTETAACC